MAAYDLPTSIVVTSMEWGILKTGVAFRSEYSGSRQALDFVSDRWTVSLGIAPVIRANSGAVEALFGLLTGGVNRLRLWHRTRPVPRGTMQGSPTVATTATRGAASLTLQTTAGATLLAGDLFGAGQQLFQVAQDCAANGSGVLAVPLVSRVRATTASGVAVTWNRPTAEFVLPSMSTKFPHSAFVMQGFPVDFEEAY